MEFFEFTGIAEALFINDPLKQYLWAYLLIGAFGFAVLYIFEAVALFTIATRNGDKRKWMAFVPVLNTYYIGVLADKNRVFNRVKPKYCSAAMAAIEAVCIVMYILHYIAEFKVFGGYYAEVVYTPYVSMGTTFELPDGYIKVSNFPAHLEWAWWMAMKMPTLVISWFELVYNLIGIFVLVAFFRTYSSPRYFIFVIFSVLFPIKGIFMFAVRNNRAKNYGEYLREQQQRQYRMYHEYMRNGQGGYGGGYGGNYNNQYGQGNPYNQGGQGVPPEDPFGGLGGQGGNSSSNGSGQNSSGSGDDPFSDL